MQLSTQIRNKLNFWLTGIILLIASSVFAQAKDSTNLPSNILPKIIDELLVKDHLLFVVSKQDSILRVYDHRDSTQQVQIAEYKLKGKNYEDVIAKLQESVQLYKDELRIVDKTKHKLSWKIIYLKAVVVIEAVIIVGGIILLIVI